MTVTAKMFCEVEITSIGAIIALCDNFGIKNGDFGNYCIREEKGVKGIYYAKDISLHGSPVYSYQLIHQGSKAIKVYRALKLLKDEYDNILQEQEQRYLKSLQR